MKQNAKILIVDDEIENLKILNVFLKKEGYQVITSENGKEALNILKDDSIDLVLLDIMMPVLDGYEVCRLMKSNPDWANIPVIFLTARSEVEDIVLGFETGAVDFIQKPFHREELFVRLQYHLQTKFSKEELIDQANSTSKSRDLFMRTLYEFSKTFPDNL